MVGVRMYIEGDGISPGVTAECRLVSSGIGRGSGTVYEVSEIRPADHLAYVLVSAAGSGIHLTTSATRRNLGAYGFTTSTGATRFRVQQS